MLLVELVVLIYAVVMRDSLTNFITNNWDTLVAANTTDLVQSSVSFIKQFNSIIRFI